MSYSGKVCKVCGKVIPDPAPYSLQICSQTCFYEDFWNEALDEDAIIIEGKCYHMEPEKSDSTFRGFGGRKFTVKFNDGRVVETTNLWLNGDIPKERKVSDNAVFI